MILKRKPKNYGYWLHFNYLQKLTNMYIIIIYKMRTVGRNLLYANTKYLELMVPMFFFFLCILIRRDLKTLKSFLII